MEDGGKKDIGSKTFETFIKDNQWTFAKSMPRNPHEYCLKNSCTDKAVFERLVMHIRKHGYDRYFWRKRFRYLNIGDHMYWTMGAPIEETTLINRALIKDNE